MESQQIKPHPYIIWLSDNRIRIELILVLLNILIYYLISDSESKNQALGISLTTLSIFYFFSAFLQIALKDIIEMIVYKVANIGSAVAIIGILFMLLELEGAFEQTIIGSVSLIVAGVVLLIKWMISRNDTLLPLILRSLLLASVTWLMIKDLF